MFIARLAKAVIFANTTPVAIASEFTPLATFTLAVVRICFRGGFGSAGLRLSLHYFDNFAFSGLLLNQQAERRLLAQCFNHLEKSRAS